MQNILSQGISLSGMSAQELEQVVSLSQAQNSQVTQALAGLGASLAGTTPAKPAVAA